MLSRRSAGSGNALKTERDATTAEVEKLQQVIRHLLRAQYGPRSEKCDADQLQLGLEEAASVKGNSDRALLYDLRLALR